MKTFLGLLTISVLFALMVFSMKPISEQIRKTSMLASVWFEDSINSNDLKRDYKKRNNIKVMIVPGHDDINSGAEYDGVSEASMNLRVAEYLYKYLNDNQRIDVTLSRDRQGYNKDLNNYLINKKDEIREFVYSQKDQMRRLMDAGEVDSYINIEHNTAPSRVVEILYGINKYVNDNDYDIVIHIHFNDYAGRKVKDGEYSGYSIYVPEQQYSNAKATKEFADSIADSLDEIFPKSNLPKEGSVVESQDLIAIGSYNTADSISLLMEYGYIYERQFHDPEIKDIIFNELAYQTYLGITDFFGDSIPRKNLDFVNNHVIQKSLTKGDSGKDVLALQVHLRNNDLYPLYPANLSGCPVNGYFGECTEKSLKEFQRRYDVEEYVYLGPKTRDLLKR